MRKILSLITALLLIFSLSACGGDKTENTDATAETTQEASVETEESSEDSAAVDTSDAKDTADTKDVADAKNSEDAKAEEASENSSEEQNVSEIETEIITPSENKDDNRPTVYWATSEDKDTGDVAYHKKDCSVIKDKAPQELPWEIVDALGMPACTKCNPGA